MEFKMIADVNFTDTLDEKIKYKKGDEIKTEITESRKNDLEKRKLAHAEKIKSEESKLQKATKKEDTKKEESKPTEEVKQEESKPTEEAKQEESKPTEEAKQEDLK